MPKIETKTFDKDHKPIERDIIKYCSKCGKQYYGDKCPCIKNKTN